MQSLWHTIPIRPNQHNEHLPQTLSRTHQPTSDICPLPVLRISCSSQTPEIFVMVDVIIAIDPDVDKNGVALLNVKTKQLVVKTLTFAPTLDYVEVAHAKAKMQKQNFLVVVEGGWLNRSHWHINRERSRFHAAAIGNAVGRNHETGIHLCEVFKYKGIPLVIRPPLRKCWKGHDRKITAEELNCITKQNIRTNQEGRDAVLLAWTEAYSR